MELFNLYLENALIFDFFIILFTAAMLINYLFKTKFKSSLIAGFVIAILLVAWESTKEFILNDFGFMFWIILAAFWAFSSHKLLKAKLTKGTVFFISLLYFLFYVFLYPNMRETVPESFQTILFWAFIVGIILLIYFVGSWLFKGGKGISIKVEPTLKKWKEKRVKIKKEAQKEEDAAKAEAEQKRKEIEDKYDRLFALADEKIKKLVYMKQKAEMHGLKGAAEAEQRKIEKLEQTKKKLEQRKKWALGDISERKYKKLRGIKKAVQVEAEKAEKEERDAEYYKKRRERKHQRYERDKQQNEFDKYRKQVYEFTKKVEDDIKQGGGRVEEIIKGYIFLWENPPNLSYFKSDVSKVYRYLINFTKDARKRGKVESLKQKQQEQFDRYRKLVYDVTKKIEAGEKVANIAKEYNWLWKTPPDLPYFKNKVAKVRNYMKDFIEKNELKELFKFKEKGDEIIKKVKAYHPLPKIRELCDDLMNEMAYFKNTERWWDADQKRKEVAKVVYAYERKRAEVNKHFEGFVKDANQVLKFIDEGKPLDFKAKFFLLKTKHKGLMITPYLNKSEKNKVTAIMNNLQSKMDYIEDIQRKYKNLIEDVKKRHVGMVEEVKKTKKRGKKYKKWIKGRDELRILEEKLKKFGLLREF